LVERGQVQQRDILSPANGSLKGDTHGHKDQANQQKSAAEREQNEDEEPVVVQRTSYALVVP
jgi:hypothetical protein